MAKKKHPAQAGPPPRDHPPGASQDVLHYWSTFKQTYPAFLILLVKGAYYVSLDWDAETLSEVIGYAIEPGPPDLCYFPARDLDKVLRSLTNKGFYVAICYPSEDPKQQSFT